MVASNKFECGRLSMHEAHNCSTGKEHVDFLTLSHGRLSNLSPRKTYLCFKKEDNSLRF